MIRRFLGVMAAVGCVLLPAPAALAQAKGSAEAAAAKRANPNWKAPRNAWGHPDLEGIWTTDDMRGVPMSRPAQFGTRAYLTDEEFAESRQTARERARHRRRARPARSATRKGRATFGYTSMVIDPPDGRVPAMTAAARARPRPAIRARSASARGTRSRTSRSTTAASRAA